MTPHAIATTNVDGRSACMYYGFCKNGCKSDAKGGGHVSYVPRAVGAGAEIRPGCFVLRVESEGGRATGVTYLEERFQPVERVFVSCYSIETPRLLLRSEVANSSDQVWRNLMTHTGRSCTGASTGPWTASSVGENDRAIAAAGTELATRALEAAGATASSRARERHICSEAAAWATTRRRRSSAPTAAATTCRTCGSATGPSSRPAGP